MRSAVDFIRSLFRFWRGCSMRRTGMWIVGGTVMALLVPAAMSLAGTVPGRSGAAGNTGSARVAAAAPAAFAHPGVVVGRAQLDLVRTKVAAGAQPWKSAYDQMR